MINGIDDEDGDAESDSDNEESDENTEDDDNNSNNNNNNNDNDKTKEQDDEEKGFLGRVFETLLDKIKLLNSRVGRAGLIHNFLRGLEVLSGPVLSGL